jgi:hypothetical protein
MSDEPKNEQPVCEATHRAETDSEAPTPELAVEPEREADSSRWGEVNWDEFDWA